MLAQALHAHLQARAAAGEVDAQGAVVNLLDQKLWNQNPDFFELHTLQSRAGGRWHHAGHGAGAARARGGRGARPDA